MSLIFAVIGFVVFLLWCVWSGRELGPSMIWINAVIGWILGYYVFGPLLSGAFL